MKCAYFAPALMAAALSLAACASAQSVEKASIEAPSADAAKPAFTLDTPIRDLVADPAARAVLDKELPGLTTHAQYGVFKGMSLKKLQPLSGGLITDERLAATGAALKALAAE